MFNKGKIMKKTIFASIALLAALTACNDDYNDQFNIDSTITDVKNITYTLQNADYKSVADNSTNKELALAKDPENQSFLTALTQVGTNKYFNDDAPAEDYIPAFLANKYPNADTGSKFTVTFNSFQPAGTFMADFNTISETELTSDDYKTVWGENITASYLSPATLNKIPVLLKSKMKTPATGDKVVVNYAYSSVEPSTGGSSSEVTYDKVSDVIANTAGGTYNVKGEVIGTYGRGFILNDGTASILVYLNATANYSVGDVVTVSGTTSKYSGIMQFPANSEISLVERKTSFAYPTNATAMSAADLVSYVAAPTVKYAKFSGKLKISGTYYNIELGAEGVTLQGSISYPVGGVVASELNDKNVTVTGYLIGGSSKYANIMATSIVEQGTVAEYEPVGVVALSSAGAHKVRGVVAATYAKGFLVTDGTGNILVYLNKAHEYKQGDVVTVSGTTSKYSGFMQFPATSEIAKVADATFKVPAARALTTEDMEAYLTAPYVAYVTYTGTLNISGNYYNIIVDGSTTVQGSLSYPNEGLVDASLNGKKVTVTGYAIGVSSSKFLNTMVVSVAEATTAAKAAMISRAATAVTPNSSALYTYDGSAWKEYKNSDVKVAVVDPSVYTSLGSTSIATPDFVLPTFLTNKFPYAVEGNKAVVVYNKKANTPVAAEYEFNGVWAPVTSSVATTVTFTKEATGISANMSVFLNETFLGDEGGFVAHNVALGALSYVWTNTTSYGWKASAFLNNTNNVTDSYLVSPAVNLKKAVAPIMTFDEAHRYLNNAEPTKYFEILISTDFKGDVSTCTWSVLPVENWSDGSTWDFVNVGTIDLNAYKGNVVYVAFRYKSDADAAATWEVKNLKIYEKESEGGSNE